MSFVISEYANQMTTMQMNWTNAWLWQRQHVPDWHFANFSGIGNIRSSSNIKRIEATAHYASKMVRSSESGAVKLIL